jgi:carbon storage regulator
MALTLGRKPGDIIKIGPNIEVLVVRVEGKKVRLAVTAPENIRICRGEAADLPPPPGPVVN